MIFNTPIIIGLINTNSGVTAGIAATLRITEYTEYSQQDRI